MLTSVQYPEVVRAADFIRVVREIVRGLFMRPGCT
jgi:hypothetical protein